MKFEDLQLNKTEAGLDLKPEKVERPIESLPAETNNFDLSQEITQSKIEDAQEIQRVRQEIAAVPKVESLPTVQEKKTEVAEQEPSWLASKLDTARRYLKVATLGAGIFMGADKLEASNINQGTQNKLIDKTEQAPSIDNKNEKSIDGGNLAEVVVYGRKKYEEELLKQQADMEKYAADLGKYKKDSVEWVKTNEAYQDSLSLYNKSWADYNEVIKKTPYIQGAPDNLLTGDEVLARIKDLLKPEYQKFPNVYYDGNVKNVEGSQWNKGSKLEGVDVKDNTTIVASHKPVVDFIKEQESEPIKPKYVPLIPSWGNIKNEIDKKWAWYSRVYDKPKGTKNPNLNKPESPKTEKIKYDPKYEDLHMRSLWATMVKNNPNEKIGTLKALDPSFESGFTLEEAMSFPQEIKDKYNIDYIYKQVKGKQ